MTTETPYATISDNADWLLIPDHMRGGITRWVEHGIYPGGFLTAVLENNLRDAVQRADEDNSRMLAGWVRFIYNYCPSGCWGSLEHVERWAVEAGATS